MPDARRTYAAIFDSAAVMTAVSIRLAQVLCQRVGRGQAGSDDPKRPHDCSINFATPSNSAATVPTVIKGRAASDEIVRCNQIEAAVRFPVTECSVYVHKNHPTLWQMEDIAWILRSDPKQNKIGFVRSTDLPRIERSILIDE